MLTASLRSRAICFLVILILPNVSPFCPLASTRTMDLCSRRTCFRSRACLISVKRAVGQVLPNCRPVLLNSGTRDTKCKPPGSLLAVGDAASAEQKSQVQDWWFLRTGGTAEEARRKKTLVWEVLSFALPVLGAVLVEPVLTLVDTYFIGIKLSPQQSVIGLAALAANCALFNLVTTSLSFFCTATTTVVARKSGKDPSAGGEVVSNGLFLSTAIGGLVAILLLACRNVILSKGFFVSPHALPTADQYLSIRASSIPATLASYVGTGACLGLGDTFTPLIGIAAATVTNIVGDWFLICVCNTGVAGAAVATALASYVGAAVTISILIKKLDVKWPGRPKVKDMLPFLQVSGALLLSTTLAGLTYSGTTRVANILGGVVDAAAHQIGLQSWWLLSFFGTPLALAAQSIAPRELAAGRPRIARALVNRIFVLCVALSFVIGAANWALPTYLPGLFTSDLAVAARLQSITTKATIAQVMMTIASTMDGVYVGCGRLRQYLVAGLGSTAVAWFMLSTGQGIEGAWNAMVWLSASRCLLNIGGMPRLFYKLKKAELNPEVGQSSLLGEDGSTETLQRN